MKSGRRPATAHRVLLPAAAMLLVFAATSASAVLGGDLASVQTQQTRMRAARVTAAAASGAAVHELQLADGSSVREYVNAQGVVYAVAWSTRLKPDFTQLLGRHAADFDAAVASQARAPGLQRAVAIDRGDLVVHSAGRPGAFVGRAWLKSALPSADATDAIR